jgi:hypothetical protein
MTPAWPKVGTTGIALGARIGLSPGLDAAVSVVSLRGSVRRESSLSRGPTAFDIPAARVFAAGLRLQF